jgi:hypothetical protein
VAALLILSSTNIEAAPTFDPAPTCIVSEGAEQGTFVCSFFATDVSFGPVTYSFNGASGGLAIDPSSGNVTVDGVLNYEGTVGGTISITIVATNTNAETTMQEGTVQVIDVAEAPVFDIATSTGRCTWTNVTGTAVGDAIGNCTFIVLDDDDDLTVVSLTHVDSTGATFSMAPVSKGATTILMQSMDTASLSAGGGTLTVRLTAVDAAGLSATLLVYIEYELPVTLPAPPVNDTASDAHGTVFYIRSGSSLVVEAGATVVIGEKP